MRSDVFMNCNVEFRTEKYYSSSNKNISYRTRLIPSSSASPQLSFQAEAVKYFVIESNFLSTRKTAIYCTDKKKEVIQIRIQTEQ